MFGLFGLLNLFTQSYSDVDNNDDILTLWNRLVSVCFFAIACIHRAYFLTRHVPKDTYHKDSEYHG